MTFEDLVSGSLERLTGVSFPHAQRTAPLSEVILYANHLRTLRTSGYALTRNSHKLSIDKDNASWQIRAKKNIFTLALRARWVEHYSGVMILIDTLPIRVGGGPEDSLDLCESLQTFGVRLHPLLTLLTNNHGVMEFGWAEL